MNERLHQNGLHDVAYLDYRQNEYSQGVANFIDRICQTRNLI